MEVNTEPPGQVSWDSSIRGRRESSEGFEAYLRNAITLNQSPMLKLHKRRML